MSKQVQALSLSELECLRAELKSTIEATWQRVHFFHAAGDSKTAEFYTREADRLGQQLADCTERYDELYLAQETRSEYEARCHEVLGEMTDAWRGGDEAELARLREEYAALQQRDPFLQLLGTLRDE